MKSWRRFLVIGVLPIVMGCRKGYAHAETSPQTLAEACISTAAARFDFPPEPTPVVSWNEPGESMYVGRPEFAWQVYWNLAWGEYGKRPHALWVVTYWSDTGPRQGTLRDLLARVPAWVMTSDTTPGTDLPTSISAEDPAVSASVEHGRVAFRVQGEAAIRRIFPTMPDTVRLLRRRGAEAYDEEFVVPVRHSRGRCGPPA
jgi:hypothetical protein